MDFFTIALEQANEGGALRGMRNAIAQGSDAPAPAPSAREQPASSKRAASPESAAVQTRTRRCAADRVRSGTCAEAGTKIQTHAVPPDR